MNTKKNLLIFVFALIFLAVPLVSAFNFDNVKHYNEEEAKLEINDCSLWIGTCLVEGNKIIDATRDTPQVYGIGAGYQKVAQLTINSQDDLNNALESFEFYDLNDNSKKIEKDIDVKYLTIEKEEVIIHNNFTGEDIISYNEKEVWLDFDNKIKKGESYTIGLFVSVGVDDRIEWIPTIAGKRVEEWAIYEYVQEAHGITLTGSTAFSGVRCDIIFVHQNITLFNVTKDAVATPTTCNIYNSSGTLLESGSFSGELCTFNNPTNLTEDDVYYIGTSDEGSRTLKYEGSVSFNITGKYINWTGGSDTCSPASTVATLYDILEIGVRRESQDLVPPDVTINTPLNQTYHTSEVEFNITCTDVGGSGVASANYTLNSGATNYTLVNNGGTEWTDTNSTLSDQGYLAEFFCYDVDGNVNNSETRAFSVDTFLPIVTILSPDSGINSTNNNLEVNYGLSGQTAQSCWWTNSSGEYNYTLTCGVNITGQTWKEGQTNLTIYANASDGDMGSAGLTINIDSLNQSATIYEINNSVYQYFILGSNLTLNWSINETNLDSVWYNLNGTNITLEGLSNVTNVTLGDYYTDLIFSYNDTFGNIANTYVNWSIWLFQNSLNFNVTTYETKTEGFSLNLTSGGSQTILADLSYAGTLYTGTKTGDDNHSLFTVSLDAIATPGNATLFWNVSYGGSYVNSSHSIQYVNNTLFNLCNASSKTPYINFTFLDDGDSSHLNATIDSSTFYYYLGSGTVNKSYLYNNAPTEENNYSFCLSPSYPNLNLQYTIQFSASGYPQRRFTDTRTLTNASYAQLLYLLSSTDGTYSTYQTQTSAGSSISGVAVTVERQFSGVWTVIEQGTTGDDGGVTFWLNPDFDHRLTFTKTGYSTVTTTIRPTQSVYTITMDSASSSDAQYSSQMDGIYWSVNPPIGRIEENTVYLFGFNVTVGSGGVMSQCRLRLYDPDRVLLNSTTGCSSTGGNISVTLNTSSYSKISGEYAINNGSAWIVVDTDARWYTLTLMNSQGTIWRAISNMRDINAFGSNDNRKEFTRLMMFFIILFLVMGSISYKTGWDFATGGASIYMLTAIIVLCSFPGLLSIDFLTSTNNPSVGFAFINKYFVAIISSLLAGGYFLNQMSK